MICGNCQAVVDIPADRVFPGLLLGNDFMIQSEIAAGGMGTVFLAHQISLDVDIALKVLHPQFSSNQAFITDFVKEARNAAQLSHPNIMYVNAVGMDDDIYYIGMELIAGRSVGDILDSQHIIEMDESLRIISAIAVGLEHAWTMKQIVHRDLKPDNIMIRESDQKVKLADLGLARAASEVDYDDDEFNATPQYMCPEAMTCELIDNRSDIYSLGATWYHMVTGRVPFDGDDGMAIAMAHVQEELVPPHRVNPDIPEDYSDIICRMMQKAHEDRYQSYAELLEAIGSYRRMARKRERRRTSARKVMTTTRTDIPVASPPPPPKSAKGLVATMVAVVVLLAGGIAAVLMAPKDPVEAPTSAAAAQQRPQEPTALTPTAKEAQITAAFASRRPAAASAPAPRPAGEFFLDRDEYFPNETISVLHPSIKKGEIAAIFKATVQEPIASGAFKQTATTGFSTMIKKPKTTVGEYYVVLLNEEGKELTPRLRFKVISKRDERPDCGQLVYSNPSLAYLNRKHVAPSAFTVWIRFDQLSGVKQEYLQLRRLGVKDAQPINLDTESRRFGMVKMPSDLAPGEYELRGMVGADAEPGRPYLLQVSIPLKAAPTKMKFAVGEPLTITFADISDSSMRVYCVPVTHRNHHYQTEIKQAPAIQRTVGSTGSGELVINESAGDKWPLKPGEYWCILVPPDSRLVLSKPQKFAITAK
jgi:hypothetical protein